ncbi:MAG: hypothetical protein IKY82_07175 [Alistipes sp.]|nr:hypothetical protein [Alistipes sp.]
MEQKELEFLNSFAEKLSDTLVKQCTADGMLDGKMLLVEELNDKWRTSAPEYMVAAVPQIAEYPSAAIAWACYVGMGAAVLWDKSWGDYKDTEDWYTLMAKPRGFDALDEYVVECLVGYKLDSEENNKLETTIRKCAHTAQTMIRKEGIEPQSVMAFHLFAKVVKVFFELGVSLELRHRGYKYVKVNLNVNGEAPIS